MTGAWWSVACCGLLGLSAANGMAAESSLVRKVAETFDDAAWPVDGWNRAIGTTSLVTDGPAGKCLGIEIRFSGKGFEWFAAGPVAPLAIPGDIKSLQLRYRLGDKRYPLILTFKDGWGRSEADKKKLEWALPSTVAGQWTTATFRVPADWVRPISISGISTHNWSLESQANTVQFRLDEIQVETDIAGIDPQTGLLKSWKPDPQPKDPKAVPAQPRTPLVDMACSTGQTSNVFVRTEPAVAVSLRNWRPGPLEGTLRVEVRDSAGQVCDRKEQPVRVEGTASIRLPLKAERFGLYTLGVELAPADGAKRTQTMAFAKLAPSRELSATEKRASPYGVNVNGGRQNFAVEPFRKAGIVWFRDYAFSYEWMLRAKGDDHRYAGWPSYPKIVQQYRQAGAMVLPCLMKAIQPPQRKAGVERIGPDREWIRQIADILNAFPEFTHWELDNEYDLAKDHAETEGAIRWRNYGAYHRKLAELVALLGNGEVTAVEQGAAGIYPERIRQQVESGDFAKVGVVNSHYYCGAEPPEVNVGNWNMDTAGDFRRQPPALFFDRLRAAKRAGCGDSRARESWLTEFGWDNLAGPRVSAEQQAAYLPRGWLLAMAAGTDKCFWFYDYDAAEPKQFFDGCGLLAADGSPKLSLCAMAGLTSVLPAPKYVGSISAGPGTCGFVFADGDKRVAAMWSIEEPIGPQVTFRAQELRDYLGNRLDGLTTRLSTSPVYAVGLEKDDAWYRQTAYELDTPHLVGTTAGDAVTAVLCVKNNRAGPIQATVHVTPPQGWAAEKTEIAASVPAGQAQRLSVRLAVPPNEPMGAKEAVLTIVEEETVQRIPLKILVQPALFLEVGPLQGAPASAKVAIKVGNRSERPLDGTLRLRLPQSWRAETPEIQLLDLKPDETRQVDCRLAWDVNWQPGETATAEFDGGGGRLIRASIAPSRLRVHQVRQITLDGRADDWPSAAELPEWIVSGRGPSPARIRLGWGKDGLYGLVEVAEADVENPDPRSFWACTCLELFVDSRDDKRADRPYAAGDHQFWLVPLVAQGRVFAGQWKRGDETPQTRYDIAAIQGVALAKGHGFVMEFCIPASELKGLGDGLATGRSLGVNFNLTIKGKQGMREVSWPAAKNSGVLGRPGIWGSMELAE